VTPQPPAPASGYPAAPPPPPGAFPAYGAAPSAPVERPTGIPTTVNAAFWLYIASAVLAVVGGIITVATAGNSRAAAIQQLQNSGTNLHGQSAEQLVNAFIAFAIGWSIVTLIFWAIVFVLFAFFMRRGANWARIVLTVLTAISLLNALTSFGVGALQVILSIVAVILIWLRPSSAWFAAIKASKAPRA
jgi:Mn2+/Fe2+ NRAMP family transporter